MCLYHFCIGAKLCNLDPMKLYKTVEIETVIMFSFDYRVFEIRTTNSRNKIGFLVLLYGRMGGYTIVIYMYGK